MTDADAPADFDASLLEERPEDLYEHAPCGYVSTYPTGIFAKINQTFLSWTGYSRDELLGSRRLQDLLTVGGRMFYETHILPLLHMQGFVNEIAVELVCQNGQRLPILFNSVQRRDPNGAPLLHRTTIFNASDRREYERELLLARKQAEQAADRLVRLQTVMAALAEAVDPAEVAEMITQQGIAALNAQAGLVAVMSADRASLNLVHAIGYPAHVLASWQRFPLALVTPLTDAARTGEPILLDSPVALAARYPQFAVMAAGTRSMAAIPLSINGSTNGVLGLSFTRAQAFSAEDRTFLLTLTRQCSLALERSQLYEAERSARAEAQAALRIRDDFLSIASHELKNPLASLLGNVQILQRRAARAETISERDQRNLAAIVGQATRLDKLITELLDSSQIESAQLSIASEPLDLGALVARIVAEQPPLPLHPLTCSLPGSALMISGDPLRLEQVIQNLLQNAIKYSPAGGQITLAVAQRGQTACVTVSDQGIGIPAAALPQLFQRFYRAANVDRTGIGGMGIGLYVVRQIAALHGGSISVESTEGAGSQFTLCLPLAPQILPAAS